MGRHIDLWLIVGRHIDWWLTCGAPHRLMIDLWGATLTGGLSGTVV